jgi:hypothetical protein
MALIKHKIVTMGKSSLFILALLVASFGVMFPAHASAQSCGDLSGADVQACQTRIDNCDSTLQGSDARFRDGCHQSVYQDFGLSADGSASTLPTDASASDTACKPDQGQPLDANNCRIVYYIVVLTRALATIVGIVIVIMIAVGGIQYTAARDDPQAVNVAKQRIQNAIFALLFYIFGFAFLQWLVPGGIF